MLSLKKIEESVVIPEIDFQDQEFSNYLIFLKFFLNLKENKEQKYMCPLEIEPFVLQIIKKQKLSGTFIFYSLDKKIEYSFYQGKILYYKNDILEIKYHEYDIYQNSLKEEITFFSSKKKIFIEKDFLENNLIRKITKKEDETSICEWQYDSSNRLISSLFYSLFPFKSIELNLEEKYEYFQNKEFSKIVIFQKTNTRETKTEIVETPWFFKKYINDELIEEKKFDNKSRLISKQDKFSKEEIKYHENLTEYFKNNKLIKKIYFKNRKKLQEENYLLKETRIYNNKEKLFYLAQKNKIYYIVSSSKGTPILIKDKDQNKIFSLK